VAEADPENREPWRECTDRFDRDAGFLGSAGAGRNNDGVGTNLLQLLERGIVANDDRLGPQRAERLREVVDEGVEVVDQKEPHGLLAYG
jgi:hypothetical protein